MFMKHILYHNYCMVTIFIIYTVRKNYYIMFKNYVLYHNYCMVTLLYHNKCTTTFLYHIYCLITLLYHIKLSCTSYRPIASDVEFQVIVGLPAGQIIWRVQSQAVDVIFLHCRVQPETLLMSVYLCHCQLVALDHSFANDGNCSNLMIGDFSIMYVIPKTVTCIPIITKI